MVVLRKQKHIYVELIKTGTHSVRRWLRDNYMGKIVKPGDEYHHSCNVPDEYKDYTVFVTVRNPYERTLSHYYFSNLHQPLKAFLQYLLDSKEGIFKEGVKFPYIHCSQKKQYDIAGAKEFIRLEHFRKDALAKLDFVKRTVPKLPRLHVTPGRPKKRALECYTKSELDMIWECYKEDFEAFGYEKS